MAVVDITTLKSYFEKKNVPTEANYIDLLDTMFSLSADFTELSLLALAVGNATFDPADKTLFMSNGATAPSFSNLGQQLYSINSSLLAVTAANRKFSLNAGYAGLLSPLCFPQVKLLLFPRGIANERDIGPYTQVFGCGFMENSWGKTPNDIAPLYCASFNGSTSYEGSDMDGTLLNNNFTVGGWVYIDATGRNHGFYTGGITTVAWWLYWESANNRFVFSFYDTSAALRTVYHSATLTTGWHFIGVEYNHTGGYAQHIRIQYDLTYTDTDNTFANQMRQPAGNFRIGQASSSAYLDGKIATVWISGYMPEASGNLMTEYFYNTQGLFFT